MEKFALLILMTTILPLLFTGASPFVIAGQISAMVLTVWAGIPGHLQVSTIIAGIIVTTIIVMRIIIEEQFLRACYSDYIGVALKTKRILPLKNIYFTCLIA